MAEFSIDRFAELYADRTAGMSASEVRALFAVASRPEIVSFAGDAVRAGAPRERRAGGRR
jgi:2-aminoadipate transaminase